MEWLNGLSNSEPDTHVCLVSHNNRNFVSKALEMNLTHFRVNMPSCIHFFDSLDIMKKIQQISKFFYFQILYLGFCANGK